MDSHTVTQKPNPREGASCLSIWSFWYTLPMFRTGYARDLEVEDLYNPINSDRSTFLGDRLESTWLEHYQKCKKLNRKPSLLRTLLRTFWKEYCYLGLLVSFMELILRLTQPLMLGELLDYFRAGSPVSREDALLYAGVIVAFNLCNAFIINQYVLGAFHVGMKVRAACCAMIYRKSLRLSRTALGETASGKVVNLLSNDVSRFDVVSIFLNHMWVAPTSALFVTYFLWMQAGYAGVFGIVVVFIVVPLQGYTGKLSSRFRLQTALKTDERVRLMDEIISGVQVIKMYAWEIPFAKLIKFARRMELKIVTKTSYVRGLYMTFNLFTTRFALSIALLTIVLMGEEITAPRVFVLASYFNILSMTMSSMFVRGISEVAEVLVAIKRLQTYMLHEEFRDANKSQNNNVRSKGMEHAVLIDQAYAKWNPASSDYTLADINLEVESRQLMGIIGTVGAGKSSLLQLILGELTSTSGDVLVNGKVSYACQEPWVFAASIRQNIVFGSEFNKRRYNEVVRVCALEKDLKQFPFGDLTPVGDRGASLSGGQKARINLARAIYRNADIYLLDDPLSAVDTHVARHLYEECINGYLANKTRILVTHQVQHLKDANRIVILNNGRVEAQDTYKNLANSGVQFAELLTEDKEPSEEEKIAEIKSMKIMRQMSSRSKSVSITSTMSHQSGDESCEEDKGSHEIKEESSKGKVKGNLGLRYLKAGGAVHAVIIVLLYLITQIVASGADYFVSFWTKEEDLRRQFNELQDVQKNNSDNATFTQYPISEPILTTEACAYIFCSLVIAIFVIGLTRSLTFYNLCMKSSQRLHDAMFYGVVGSAMRFFDTNPSGRILNRFSKDIGSIDELLPKAILDASQIILAGAGSIILASVVNPYFLIAIFLLGIIFMYLRMVYLKTSKNVKRLEGITRSPVFTHLNATLQGLTTIRAYGAQGVLMREFDKHQDLHTSAWFMFIASSSAFGFSLDIICFVFTGLVTFSFLLFSENVSGGDVGLAITQAAALTGLVQWGMRQSAEVANQLMSVERVLEYTELTPEKQPQKPLQPSPSWPEKGQIEFKNAGLRYIENEPLVLHDLNFAVKPMEKIGIVGRTGAGKSSLIGAIFRLAQVEGFIEIDGIETSKLNLQKLRSKISIIPQDPVLFSGTLRRNLDPFDEYQDHVLWNALGDVELKDITDLSCRVFDKGSNFSVGQRQLVCLARAIIRNNKILMLDEATANVDPQTDALIQKTIRQKFCDCTVLTVAHRLNTIMDSDKVLVMDNGTMAELDHPHTLLQNPNSIFSKMVAETGKSMQDQLKKIAKQTFEAATAASGVRV